MAVFVRCDYVEAEEKVYRTATGKGKRGTGKATGKLTAGFFTFSLYPFPLKI